jgi:hypothetical protein
MNVVTRTTPWALRDYALWQCALRVADDRRARPADPRSMADATAAARSWLEALDEGNCSGSFERAAVFLRRALGAEAWERALTAVRAPLGRCLSRRIRSRRLVGPLSHGPRGPCVVIRFESEFEGRAHVVETLVPAIGRDGRWRVAGYLVA